MSLDMSNLRLEHAKYWVDRVKTLASESGFSDKLVPACYNCWESLASLSFFYKGTDRLTVDGLMYYLYALCPSIFDAKFSKDMKSIEITFSPYQLWHWNRDEDKVRFSETLIRNAYNLDDGFSSSNQGTLNAGYAFASCLGDVPQFRMTSNFSRLGNQLLSVEGQLGSSTGSSFNATAHLGYYPFKRFGFARSGVFAATIKVKIPLIWLLTPDNGAVFDEQGTMPALVKKLASIVCYNPSNNSANALLNPRILCDMDNQPANQFHARAITLKPCVKLNKGTSVNPVVRYTYSLDTNLQPAFLDESAYKASFVDGRFADSSPFGYFNAEKYRSMTNVGVNTAVGMQNFDYMSCMSFDSAQLRYSSLGEIKLGG